MGENGDMGEKNNGILQKTSPNSPFIILHSSFIIHHFLHLHFFKRLNSYESLSFPSKSAFICVHLRPKNLLNFLIPLSQHLDNLF